MSNKTKNCYYSKRHLWVEQLKGSHHAYIGMTDYLAETFSNLDCIDLPDVGEEFDVDTPLIHFHVGSKIYPLPVQLTGRVLEINKDMQSDLSLLFMDPEHNWLLKIEYDDPDEFDDLMDKKQYLNYLDEL